MGSALLLSFLADGLGNMSPVLTGIESCTVNKTVNPGLVYDYHGRRVGEDSRGIVIENGQKVLKITNPDQFWSLTNYLVIQID